LTQINREACQLAGNLFGEGLTPKDFVSLDVKLLTTPRPTNGTLPETGFMRPVPKGKMVDAGEKIANGSEPFTGRAPDAGAYELSDDRRAAEVRREETRVIR
jgi:hypothetical protein